MDWNITGHEWAAEMLRRHIASQQPRHAYLFSGAPGIGRRTLALRFAQALNCPQPPQAGQPCGQCRICRQIGQMQHADLSVVQAESEGGTLKIEQVRELQRALALTPYEARYRIALLLRFEEANASAQNALLKTLEEAPPSVILLLTAASSESLLPTIVSRCEVLRLRPLPVERLEALLVERWQTPAADARRLAHLSGGRPGYALRLREDPGGLEQRRAWIDDLGQLLAAPRRQRFAYVERVLKDKEKLRQALQVWLSFWRDIFLTAAGARFPLTNLDQEAEVHRLAAAVGPATAHACTAALEEALVRLDANANPRLLAEVTLLDWPRL